MDEAAVRLLRELFGDERRRAQVIEALAPELPPAGLQPAVDAALYLLELGYDASAALRAVALRALALGDPLLLVGPGESLAWYLPDGDLIAFAELASAIPEDFHEPRARLLAALAVRLAGADQPDAALALLEHAGGGIDADWIGAAAAQIAPTLAGPEAAERLLAIAMTLTPDTRAAALIALAPRLTSEHIGVLAETAEAVEAASTQARLYMEFVRMLPEEERANEARRLLDIAFEMSPAVRAIVAVTIADRLDPPERDLAIAIGVAAATEALRADEASGPWFWDAILGALALAEDEPRRVLADALLDAAYRGNAPPVTDTVRAVLAKLEPDDRSAALMAALRPIMAPPPAAPPEPPPAPAPEPPPEPPDPEFDDLDDLEAFDDLDELAELEELARQADQQSYEGRRPPKPAARPPRVAVVNTGFAEPADPGKAISAFAPLHPGEWHFWLEVGDPLPESIEMQPMGLLASVPSGSTVTVALYPVSEGVEIVDGLDTAELEVRPDGSAIVTRGAAELGDPALSRRRLAFPIRIAPGTGEIELRCSIFRRQLLVQSRLIRARVAAAPSPAGSERVLTSDVDYLLVRRLAPRQLERVAEHRLSLMLNGDGDTHNLHALVAGEDRPVTHSARFDGGEIQDMIKQARRAFRSAAFGSPEPWHEGDRYRYGGPLDRARLEEDLLELAVRGYRFYDACINRLAGSYEAAVDLARRTRRTAAIQIALKQRGGLLLPAALFYDQPLDTGLPELRLCPEFLAAVGDLDALLGSPCFDGACPSHDDVDVVCPSGFWGYRHDLGLPLSLDELDEVSFEIAYDAHPQLGVAVSTDPQFTLRAEHERQLRALRPDLGWRYAATRADAINLMRMREGPAQLLYFYCHGGLSAANAPFLGVGGVDEPGITSDALRTYDIHWSDPRPLVFINGCHTTALEPDTALDFVSRLVDTAAATGVIGTEITTFEPLAGAFALECLRRFLGGEPIGAAVRGARLALLAQGNPLGLIYVPFVMPSVQLVARATAVPE